MSTARQDGVTLWLAWKRVGELSRGRILAHVLAASSLTEAELTVLAHLDESGGVMRQNALASVAGWDRTRLSHLLTRMEQRGHVRRERLRNGVDVRMDSSGRAALAATRPPLAEAVSQHFTSRLTVEQRKQLRSIVEALGGD